MRPPGKFLLDLFVSPGFGELVGHADAVIDGVVIRGSVTDDAHATHTQQHRAAVFGVVEAPAELVEGLPRKQRPHLGRDGAGERFPQHVAHKTANALAGLECYVAHKTVADNHVGVAVEDVAAFHIADELDGERFEQLKRLTREVVALGLFFADGEQADARFLHLEHAAGVHLTHYGELLQVMGLAIHVGAHVEQHAGVAGRGRHGSRQRRPIDAGQGAQHHLGGSHRRAGVSCRDEARALVLADQLQSNAHRAVFFGAYRVGGLLVHANAFGGMLDGDGQVLILEVLVEQVAQLRLRPNEMDPYRKGAAGKDGAPNLRLRGLVAAECVQRYVDQHVLALAGNYLASLTSRTARPLYSPHLAQARWGSFFSWQLGHSETPVAVKKSWERRRAVRRVEWRRFGFGMVQFLSVSFALPGSASVRNRPASQESATPSNFRDQHLRT